MVMTLGSSVYGTRENKDEGSDLIQQRSQSFKELKQKLISFNITPRNLNDVTPESSSQETEGNTPKLTKLKKSKKDVETVTNETNSNQTPEKKKESIFTKIRSKSKSKKNELEIGTPKIKGFNNQEKPVSVVRTEDDKVLDGIYPNLLSALTSMHTLEGGREFDIQVERRKVGVLFKDPENPTPVERKNEVRKFVKNLGKRIKYSQEFYYNSWNFREGVENMKTLIQLQTMVGRIVEDVKQLDTNFPFFIPAIDFTKFLGLSEKEREVLKKNLIPDLLDTEQENKNNENNTQ